MSAAVQPVSSHVKDTTTQAFAADVIQASKQQPVIVDFWAPWCGPCKQLTPVLEKAVAAAGGKVKLVKMNIDEHPAIAGQLGVQSIPTVIAFKNGQPVDAFMGALPESQVKQFIDGLGGAAPGAPDPAELLKAGEDALKKSDALGALQSFAAVLSLEPENLRALAGMGQAYLNAGETEQAKALLAGVPAGKADDPVFSSVKSALELAEKTSSLGGAAELQAKADADPKNCQARFDLALALAAEGKRQEAVDALMVILNAKRDWNEGAAKTQLLQFFDAWGFDDDAAIYGRKKLSSLLFA